MYLNHDERTLILDFQGAIPVPPCSDCPKVAVDRQLRQWTHMLLQDLVLTQPERAWCGVRMLGQHKAQPGVIARTIDGVLWAWPIVQAIGTPDQHLDVGLAAANLGTVNEAGLTPTAAAEAVRPSETLHVYHAHLGPVEATPGPVESVPLEGSHAQILAHLASLEAQILALHNRVAEHSRESQKRDAQLQRKLFDVETVARRRLQFSGFVAGSFRRLFRVELASVERDL